MYIIVIAECDNGQIGSFKSAIRKLEKFDIAQRVRAIWTGDREQARRTIICDFRSGHAGIVDRCVHIGTAIQKIIAQPSAQGVVTSATGQDIGL